MLTPLGNYPPAMARPAHHMLERLHCEWSVTLEERFLSLRLLGHTRATAAQFHQAKSPFPRHEGQRCSLGARRAPECSPPWRHDVPHELSARPDARQELTGAASFALPENFAPPPPEPFHERTPQQPTGLRRHELERGNFREHILEQPLPVHSLQSREKQPLRPRERKSQRGRPPIAPPAEQQPEAAPAGACWRQTAAAAREGAAPPDVFPPHGSAWRDSADRFPHLRPDCELPD